MRHAAATVTLGSMCDYCDCRSHPPVADLSAEHAEVALGLARIERAWEDGDVTAAASAQAALVALLERHGASEERGLYVELGAEGVVVDGLDAEHGRIDAGLRATDRATVTAAIAALRAHVHREEYDLFPAAHQLLADDAWERLALDSRASSRAGLDAPRATRAGAA